ncbi:hypothetical protein [Rhodococcus sp. B10]|uniref:hypothetical protein n=1 Tax=Rhodococcus sp. B10 TaxID=2695876 RepID=UPI001430AD26|nr:hypothetical protein [Rhodococcus sp. B10]NIL78400.1 hypothetical protein [Rhodococcus sp. B10]
MPTRIDTDRGALFGPSFDETLGYFFGPDASWECHRLTAGYIEGRATGTTAVRVPHDGGTIIVARILTCVDVSEVPAAAVQCADRQFAVGITACPELPRWVYENAQSLAV